MGRFGDQWVVDRTLFDFKMGGSCQCCGFSHIFNPEGLAGLIKEMSDLETDAQRQELTAAQRCPWPPDMRDEVWADRVRLRYKMKKEMINYKNFFDGVERNDLAIWCKEILGLSGLRKLLQMPRSEVTERVKHHYGIHSAFAVLLCTVIEQVASFKKTGYGTDARGPAEKDFEEALIFKRQCGFTLPIENEDGIDDCVLNTFIDMMMSLSGPKLLLRGPKTSTDANEDEDNAAQAGEEMAIGSRCPSFRSDRRVLRLLIARYWADRIIEKFQAKTNHEK